MIKSLFKWLIARRIQQLQLSSGVFSAANNKITGYDKVWIRDNIYESLGLEAIKDYAALKRMYHSLFDLIARYEHKLDRAASGKKLGPDDYLHPRYCPLTLDELPGTWGNKQNDAVGAFLFRVGDLESKGIRVIRHERDLIILQKLVNYLEAIRYWQDNDNGMWEENEEVHASSVGACVAGLKAINKIVHVKSQLITNGQRTLNELLPKESRTKAVDMALLSLIYPFNVINKRQALQILRNVEQHLVRKRGVARYIGDEYYGNGTEAEWTFGFPWLAKIYKDLGFKGKYLHYLLKTYSVMNWKGELPELYLGGTRKHNENSPLGWSHALWLSALT